MAMIYCNSDILESIFQIYDLLITYISPIFLKDQRCEILNINPINRVRTSVIRFFTLFKVCSYNKPNVLQEILKFFKNCISLITALFDAIVLLYKYFLPFSMSSIITCINNIDAESKSSNNKPDLTYVAIT